MAIQRKIKDNRWLRGAFFFLKSYFSDTNRKKYGHIGENVIITPPIYATCKNINIHSNVSIGSGAYLSTPNAKIVFKGNASIAEHLTIHTGNHARKVGMLITDFTEDNKPKGYDHDVVIEKDVWIGANVTILAGVTIGRGSTIAAGAVVSKNVPPYSIVGGIPAKVLKFYWTVEQVIEHEKTLYPENERFSREELNNIFSENY